ncbi:NADPH-dependent FMN reductase, partial [Streptacidiphilus jiangxiensis]
MRALLVNGSPNHPSATAAMAAVAAAALRDQGADVDVVDLAGFTTADVPDWRRAVADADAVLLATPVYHAGYSGRLKSALDLLPGDALTDKAVGVLAHGSGPRSGNVVAEQLRTVAKAMGGWVVPTQIAACPDDLIGAGDGG